MASWLPAQYAAFRPQSPLQKCFGSSQGANALIGLGSGLLSGPTFAEGLARGGQGYMQGAQQDDAYSAQKKEEAQRVATINKTAQFARAKGWNDIADLVEAGVPGASQEVIRRMQPKDPATTADITNYEYGLKHPDFAGSGEGAPFDGTGMEAQIGNILLKGDPSTAEYAYAYSLATQPKITMQQTPQGLVPVYETPNLQGIRQPTYQGGGQPSPMQPGPVSSRAYGGDVAPIGSFGGAPSLATGQPQGGISTGAALPGTAARPTEAAARAGILTGNLLYDVPIVLQNFDALSDLKSRTLGQLPGIGPAFQSDEYKSASQALGNSVLNIVYGLSGAQASNEEKANNAAGMTPTVFDGPNQIAEKKGRLVNFLQGIAQQSGDPEKQRQAQEILKSLGAATPKSPIVDMGGGITIEQLD